jgi:hypothetical protein
MPIKWKPDAKDRKRNITRYYIHTVSTEELQEVIAKDNATGKKKQKARNELVRRKAPLVAEVVED